MRGERFEDDSCRATLEAIQTVVDLFKTARDEFAAKPKVDKDEPENMGKVNYLFSAKTFAATYKDDDGKRCQTRKGAQVPTRDAAGQLLSAGDFQKQLELTKVNAQHLWDSLDKSDSERFCPPQA